MSPLKKCYMRQHHDKDFETPSNQVKIVKNAIRAHDHNVPFLDKGDKGSIKQEIAHVPGMRDSEGVCLR